MTNLNSEIELIFDKAIDIEELGSLIPTTENSRPNLLKVKNKHILSENRFSPKYKMMASGSTQQTQNTVPLPQNAAPTAINKTEMQLLMHAIPEYLPGHNLSIFIQEIDKLHEHLNGRLTPDLEYIFSCTIRSKIKNEARDYISFQNANDWNEIRVALLQKYGDQRSEELLVSALRHTVHKRNEHYSEFYARILKAYNDLMQHVQLHVIDKTLQLYKRHEYTQLSLKVFQLGILSPYREFLLHFDLTTLEECLNKCRHYDNRKQEESYYDFFRKTNDTQKKPIQQLFSASTKPSFHTQSYQFPKIQNQFSNSQTFSNYQNSQQRPPHNQNFTPKPFSGPINTPTPKPTKPFTNKQVFGNTAKPIGTTMSKLQNRPTPMSIQTKFSSSQFRPQQKQNFESYKRPAVISEELFNIELDHSNDEDTVEISADDYELCENFDNFSIDEENFQISASETDLTQ